MAVTMTARTVLMLRMTGCGCLLGVVARDGDGLSLALRQRSLVHTSETRFTAQEREVVIDLRNPGEPVDVGCEHSAGHVLDLADVLRSAEASTKRRELYLVAPH